MNDIELLFNVSNTLFLVGTSLLIRSVIKNRNVLNGYDLIGSLLTFIAMIAVTIAEGRNGFILSVVLAVPTVAYWGLVVAFKLFYRGKVEVKELPINIYGDKN